MNRRSASTQQMFTRFFLAQCVWLTRYANNDDCLWLYVSLCTLFVCEKFLVNCHGIKGKFAQIDVWAAAAGGCLTIIEAAISTDRHRTTKSIDGSFFYIFYFISRLCVLIWKWKLLFDTYTWLDTHTTGTQRYVGTHFCRVHNNTQYQRNFS